MWVLKELSFATSQFPNLYKTQFIAKLSKHCNIAYWLGYKQNSKLLLVNDIVDPLSFHT